MTDGVTIDPELQAEITALLTAQAKAWPRGDAAAFAARALPDIVFTNVVGMFSVGKEAFVAQHERIFASVYRETSIRQAIEHVATLAPDVLLVNTYARIDGSIQAPPGVVAVKGVIHLRPSQLLVRRDDGWWIAAYTNVAVRPEVTLPEQPAGA